MSSIFYAGVVGSIVLAPASAAIPGYLPCDGRTLPIDGNQILFSLIGANFGGDRDTFRLPTLAAPLPGLVYLICAEGLFLPPDARPS